MIMCRNLSRKIITLIIGLFPLLLGVAKPNSPHQATPSRFRAFRPSERGPVHRRLGRQERQTDRGACRERLQREVHRRRGVGCVHLAPQGFRGHLAGPCDGTGWNNSPATRRSTTRPPSHTDGKQLVFVSNRSGHANLWLLDLTTKKITQLTNHDSGDFRPDWSPDGEWIAFSSDRDSKKPKNRAGFVTLHSAEIYVVRPDGTGLRRLTREHKFIGPDLSKDGRKLAVYEAEIAEVENLVAVRRLRATTQIATSTSPRRAYGGDIGQRRKMVATVGG